MNVNFTAFKIHIVYYIVGMNIMKGIPDNCIPSRIHIFF